MIYSKEVEALDKELQEVLNRSKFEIELLSQNDKSFLKLSGAKFENVVCDSLNRVSEGTNFHGKFEQASTHAFPDIFNRILEDKWFGVEVKTSQNDWKCFGNSIFESTRVDNLEDRIYLFFGKYHEYIECKWARYEDCIDNINITHSPRFQVNMEVNENPDLSIFNKMNVTYSDFFQSTPTNRMNYVRELKRRELGENVALWWLPENEEPSIVDEQKLIIKLFSSLSAAKKNQIRNRSLSLFIELFNYRADYNRVLMWLASQFGVVTGSLRDVYSAGGRHVVSYSGNTLSLPRVYGHIETGAIDIANFILNTTNEQLSYYWGVDVSQSGNEKIKLWIHLISNQEHIENQNLTYDWLCSVFRL